MLTRSIQRCLRCCYVKFPSAVQSRAFGTRQPSSPPVLQQSYKYRALESNEFRVLNLYPGSFQDDIRCDLVHARLPAAQNDEADQGKSLVVAYEALSYVWGKANDTFPIKCLDRDMQITKNLFLALKHLRSKTHVRCLWADAICINQSDTIERTAQVKLMGQIYSQSTRTVVWLGEETEEVQGALEKLPLWPFKDAPALDRSVLQCISPEPNFTFQWKPNMKPPLPLPGSIRDGPNDIASWLEFQRLHLSPIMHLLARPWWRRKWVIQELVLPKDALLVCGFKSQNWLALPFGSQDLSELITSSLITLLDVLRPYMTWPEKRIFREAMMGLSLLEKLAGWRRSFHANDSSSRFETNHLQRLTQDTRDFGCSEPRDNLFAIINIALDIKDSNRSALCVDYTQSIERISLSFCRWSLQYGHYSIWHFGRVPGTRSSTNRLVRRLQSVLPWRSSLPSWAYNIVPPGTSGRFQTIKEIFQHDILKWSFSDNESFNAGRLDLYKRAQYSFRRNERELSVKGKLVDTVVATCRPYRKGAVRINRSRAHFSLTQAWIKSISQLVDSHTDQKVPSMQIFYELMTCGRKDIDYDSFVEYFRITAAIAHGSLPSSALSESHEVLKIEWLLTYVEDRRFGVTASGRKGWLPPAARKGDKICIFYGGRVPCVLHEFSAGCNNLIGEACIPGLMFGEAISGNQEHDQSFRLF